MENRTGRQPQNRLRTSRLRSAPLGYCEFLAEWLPSSGLQLPSWNEELHGEPLDCESDSSYEASGQTLQKNSFHSFIHSVIQQTHEYLKRTTHWVRGLA